MELNTADSKDHYTVKAGTYYISDGTFFVKKVAGTLKDLSGEVNGGIAHIDSTKTLITTKKGKSEYEKIISKPIMENIELLGKQEQEENQIIDKIKEVLNC